MYVDSTHLIFAADSELQDTATSAERVQELFQEWWERRTGRAVLENDVYVLPVQIIDYCGFIGTPCHRKGELHFPKEKLNEGQIEMMEKTVDADKQADEYILWAAGRAAAIAVLPIPLADVGPLMANEAYMIYRLANVYGYSIDKSVVAMLGGVAGGSLVGKLGASFLPFLKVPIAAGVTYAVGKTAKAYFSSGMTLDRTTLLDIFTKARTEADKIDWNKHKVDEND
jgi:uncharacterized protein (DUF697 family)